MAKSHHAAMSRIATTLTARYFPGTGVTDNYYLDGRLTSRREHRAADVTLDREERGFFLATFAHQAGHGPDDAISARVRKSLERILHDVKHQVRNIDAEINELAECAVDIAGRITLQHDGVRQPYFAGVMVKDAELAAITMGSGCAYLYRNDALYPLTEDDMDLEPVDYHGRPVSSLDIYCAGVAGTVRYSNIAQLQPDDCVILCNKDVLMALGQQEMLRLLYEAEDQADAAGLIITAASAKLPGVPLQVMASFVESVTPVERTAKAGSGRNVAEAGLFQQMSAKFPSGGRANPPAAAASQAPAMADPGPVAGTASRVSAPVDPLTEAGLGVAGLRNESLAGQAPVDRTPQPLPVEEDYDSPYDRNYFERPSDEGSRVRRLALYMVITAVAIGAVFAIFNMIFDKTGPTPPPAETSAIESTLETTEPTTIESTPVASETETELTEQPTETTAAPVETTAAPSAGETTHTVQSGDTFYSIAIKYFNDASNETIDKIKSYNNLSSDTLQIGQTLKIPPRG
jgi:LysM repeat protein